MVLAVVIVAVLAGSVVAYEAEPGQLLNPGRVHVLEVLWYQNGTALETQGGFTVNGGKVVPLSVELLCTQSLGSEENCTSGSLHILTSGFGIVSTNAPLTWSSGPSEAYDTVKAQISTPLAGYTGDLELNLQ